MVLIETGTLFQHCQTFMEKLQAVLAISKIFVLGGGCTCTLSLLLFMGEVLSEERASYNSLELKLGWEYSMWEFSGGNFLEGNCPGGSLMVGNFPYGNFPGGNFPRTVKNDEVIAKSVKARVYLQKQSFANVLQNMCSLKFRKFHRKISVLESFYQKQTPRQVFSYKICEIFKNTFWRSSFSCNVYLRKFASHNLHFNCN